MCMKPDFLNTLLKEPDAFYVEFLINYRGRKLEHCEVASYVPTEEIIYSLLSFLNKD